MYRYVSTCLYIVGTSYLCIILVSNKSISFVVYLYRIYITDFLKRNNDLEVKKK